jgi:hypothetical protein
MATTELHRVPAPVNIQHVAKRVLMPDSLIVEPTGDSADLAPFRSAVDELRAANEKLSATTDATLAEALHRCLVGVRRRTLLDPRTWHCLALGEFCDYTLARWADGVDPARSDELTTAQLGRFVGNATLAGRSRNAMARLYWGAETAFAVTGDYSKVAVVFAKSDLLVGVAERLLGLDPPAAIAIMERLGSLGEDERRAALVRLNFILSTTSLEALTPSEVVPLLGVD